MHVKPYIFFEGRCEEALNFYKSAVGAEVTMAMKFKDAPPHEGYTPEPALAEKIMHAEFRVGDSHILASDGRCVTPAAFNGFALTIIADAAEQTQKYFAALSAGGQIVMPLGETFFAHSFGMTTDRFGVMWMVILQKKL